MQKNYRFSKKQEGTVLIKVGYMQKNYRFSNKQEGTVLITAGYRFEGTI